jgi:hypothetical protein
VKLPSAVKLPTVVKLPSAVKLNFPSLAKGEFHCEAISPRSDFTFPTEKFS